MEDLRAYESEVHATCGQHDSIAGTQDLVMDPLTCPDCADIEIAMRIQAEADKAKDAKHGDNPPAFARLAADGRRWLMRHRRPDEVTTETGGSSTRPRPRRKAVRRSKEVA